jgi:hypothetical protein
MGKPYYEEGLHVGEITQHGIGRTKTDKPQIVWRVKVLGYPEGENSFKPHRGQYERTIYMVITEKTVPFLTETLQSIGFEGEKVSQLNPDHPQHVDMRGVQVNLWCKHEEDLSGEPRERWQFSKGATALELPQLSSKETRELDSLFGRNKNAAKPATSAPAQNIHNQEIEDDDIPF